MVRKRDSPQHDSLDDGGLRAGLELVGEPALAAVLAVLVEGHLHRPGMYSDIEETGAKNEMTHEDTSNALRRRALTAKTLDLPVRVDLIVLQNCHLHLLTLVLNLLRSLFKRQSSASTATSRKEGDSRCKSSSCAS